MAAHDEDISLVGNYNHQSFGKASYVRRGDGSSIPSRASEPSHADFEDAAVEDHARRIFLLLVEGGFVCTGPEPNVPEGWLDDVLSRSRFDFKNQDKVWATDGQARCCR